LPARFEYRVLASGRMASVSVPRSIGSAGSFADYANTVRTPGYLLLGLQAGLTLPRAILPNGSLPYAISFSSTREA
jgi:hypothetical protein